MPFLIDAVIKIVKSFYVFLLCSNRHLSGLIADGGTSSAPNKYRKKKQLSLPKSNLKTFVYFAK